MEFEKQHFSAFILHAWPAVISDGENILSLAISNTLGLMLLFVLALHIVFLVVQSKRLHDESDVQILADAWFFAEFLSFVDFGMMSECQKGVGEMKRAFLDWRWLQTKLSSIQRMASQFLFFYERH